MLALFVLLGDTVLAAFVALESVVLELPLYLGTVSKVRAGPQT